jgi:hypothetical protein
VPEADLVRMKANLPVETCGDLRELSFAGRRRRGQRGTASLRGSAEDETRPGPAVERQAIAATCS